MSAFEIGALYGGFTLLVMFSGMPIAFSLGLVATVFMVFQRQRNARARRNVVEPGLPAGDLAARALGRDAQHEALAGVE